MRTAPVERFAARKQRRKKKCVYDDDDRRKYIYIYIYIYAICEKKKTPHICLARTPRIHMCENVYKDSEAKRFAMCAYIGTICNQHELREFSLAV